MNKEDERILSNLQQPKLKDKKLVNEWYVPEALGLVSRALERGDGKESLLVVGCGYGRDAFLYSLELDLDSNVVGIDLNEESIKIAEKKAWGISEDLLKEMTPGDAKDYLDRAKKLRSKEPKFLVGDILDKNIGRKIFHESQLELFDVAVFNGVVEYFLIRRNVEQAFLNTRQLLKPKGKLVISDFAWWKPKGWGENWWEKRYRRDEEALRLIGVKGDIFGIIVVRPKGLHSEEVLSLTAKETAQALQEGDYERLVRHWRLSTIKEILKNTGFEILEKERKLGSWDVFNPLKKTKEKDKLFNYEILAKKN